MPAGSTLRSSSHPAGRHTAAGSKQGTPGTPGILCIGHAWLGGCVSYPCPRGPGSRAIRACAPRPSTCKAPIFGMTCTEPGTTRLSVQTPACPLQAPDDRPGMTGLTAGTGADAGRRYAACAGDSGRAQDGTRRAARGRPSRTRAEPRRRLNHGIAPLSSLGIAPLSSLGIAPLSSLGIAPLSSLRRLSKGASCSPDGYT